MSNELIVTQVETNVIEITTQGIMGPTGPRGEPGPPGSAYLFAHWNYVTATTGPPSSGNVLSNALDTSIELHKTDDDGTSRAAELVSIVTGETIFFTSVTGERVEWITTAPAVNNGTYVTLAVTLVEGTPADLKGELIQLGFIKPFFGTSTPLASAEVGSTGVALTGSRSDHVHPSNLSNALPLEDQPTGTAGVSTQAARADHVHPGAVHLPLAPMLYRFQATGLPPTMQGRFSGNSTTPGASTILYITYEDSDNAWSQAPRLRGIQPGTIIYMQDRTNEALWARWLVTGPIVDQPVARRVDIPIQFLNASASGITDQFILLFLTH